MSMNQRQREREGGRERENVSESEREGESVSVSRLGWGGGGVGGGREKLWYVGLLKHMLGVCAITVLVGNKAIPVPDSGWGKGQLLIYNGAPDPGHLFAVPSALSGTTATINQLEAIWHLFLENAVEPQIFSL